MEGGLVELPQIVSSTDVWPPPFLPLNISHHLTSTAHKRILPRQTCIYTIHIIYTLCEMQIPRQTLRLRLRAAVLRLPPAS